MTPCTRHLPGLLLAFCALSAFAALPGEEAATLAEYIRPGDPVPAAAAVTTAAPQAPTSAPHHAAAGDAHSAAVAAP
ncbi:MAG: hypothetical protein LBP52_02835, partial [Burkholderiaceae bacterium]|nr:hypothetical protein [Burkholderiaceae bacterium]